MRVTSEDAELDPTWFDWYGKRFETVELKRKLITELETYTHLEFDHIEIGLLGRQLCVFVTRGDQACVLYDKTKSFPSAKLLASLVLLGSK